MFNRIADLDKEKGELIESISFVHLHLHIWSGKNEAVYYYCACKGSRFRIICLIDVYDTCHEIVGWKLYSFTIVQHKIETEEISQPQYFPYFQKNKIVTTKFKHEKLLRLWPLLLHLWHYLFKIIEN